MTQGDRLNLSINAIALDVISKTYLFTLSHQYERSQLDGTALPQSANDFEKLALQSPNSSVVWLRYMAFHIELGEVEKARAVAEKALETISFRFFQRSIYFFKKLA